MDRLDGHVEHSRATGGRGPARLFDDKRQRGALVQQTELPIWMAQIARIEIDPPFEYGPVHIGYQRAGVAERVCVRRLGRVCGVCHAQRAAI